MSTAIRLPDQLEQELRTRAAERQTTVEELVRRAVDWYVRFDPLLLDELDAWQDVRDEAWEIIENPADGFGHPADVTSR